MSYFHVVVETKDKTESNALLRTDIQTIDAVKEKYVKPYVNSEGNIFISGERVDAKDIKRMRVFKTEECGRDIIEKEKRAFDNLSNGDSVFFSITDTDCIIKFCENFEITGSVVDDCA